LSFLFAVKASVRISRCIVTSPARAVSTDKLFCAMFCAIVLYTSILSSTWAQDDFRNEQFSESAIDEAGFEGDTPEATPVKKNRTSQELDLISDLLIALDTDGRSHTVQHTVASSGPTLTLTLPGSIIPQEVMFFGRDHNRQTELYKQSPNIIKINSGSAFVRYQHQYGVEVQQITENDFVLTTPSVPQNISIDHYSKDQYNLTHSATTWVFPSEYELVSYTITDSDTGRWVVNGTTITFHQIGNEPVELSINYKHKANKSNDAGLYCNSAGAPSDECADDKDEDGVPDYRDICTGLIGQESNQFGCPPDLNMVLADIEFAFGRTYLDVRARHLLDKVAYALLRYEGRYFEIGAHTDNEGAAKNNQILSQKRADAVRHYLLLRGVDPNTLRATGYGERYPIRDNAKKEGRRANRRIELVLLN